MTPLSITVLGETGLGRSTTIMGNDAMRAFKERGHDVEFSDVGRSSRPDLRASGLSKIAGRHVFSLSEFKIPAFPGILRYQPPKSVLSIYAGNMEDKAEEDTVYYLLQFGRRPNFIHVPHSKWTDTIGSRVARKWLAPSTVKLIANHTRVVPYGIESGFAPGANDPAKMLAPFNRASAQKNLELHRSVLELYQAKTNERCTLWHAPNLSPSEGFSDDSSRDMSLYDVAEQLPTREGFKQALRDYGLFLCTSNFESFGIYYLELLASGLVGVFADRPWIRELIPDYPLVVPAEELPSALLWVRANYEEAKQLIAESVAKALKFYTVERFYDTVLDIMGEFE